MSREVQLFSLRLFRAKVWKLLIVKPIKSNLKNLLEFGGVHVVWKPLASLI
jgi:hypothetical protein